MRPKGRWTPTFEDKMAEPLHPLRDGCPHSMAGVRRQRINNFPKHDRQDWRNFGNFQGWRQDPDPKEGSEESRPLTLCGLDEETGCSAPVWRRPRESHYSHLSLHLVLVVISFFAWEMYILLNINELPIHEPPPRSSRPLLTFQKSPGSLPNHISLPPPEVNSIMTWW